MSRPDVLVDPEWVEKRLGDHGMRVIEVDADSAHYRQGHIPGAIGLDWTRDLQAHGSCDFVGADALGALLGARGVGNDHRIVLYGDRDNWFAATMLWHLRYYGHHDVKLLAGGRERWIAEDRPLSTEPPVHPPCRFVAREGDDRFAADYDDGSSDGWGAFGGVAG